MGAGVAGLIAVLVASRLVHGVEGRVLHRWLRGQAQRGDWGRAKGLLLGMLSSLAAPGEARWDRHATGCAVAGSCEPRSAVWVGLGGRWVSVLVLAAGAGAVASLEARAGLIGVALAALALSWRTARAVRAGARLAAGWCLFALAAPGLTAGLTAFDAPLHLDPLTPQMDAVAWGVTAAMLSLALTARGWLLVTLGALTAAGWLGLPAAVGALIGMRVGDTLRAAGLAQRERDQGRATAAALAFAQLFATTIGVLAFASALPLLVAQGAWWHGPLGLAAAEAVLTLGGMLSWAILGSSVEESLALRLPAGRANDAPSVQLPALALAGIEHRLDTLGALAVRVANSGLAGEGLTAWKAREARAFARQLTLEVEAMSVRTQRDCLGPFEGHELSASVRCAAARAALIVELSLWAERSSSAASTGTLLERLKREVNAVHSLVDRACRREIVEPPSSMELGTLTEQLDHFGQMMDRAAAKGALAGEDHLTLTRRADELRRVAELALSSVESVHAPLPGLGLRAAPPTLPYGYARLRAMARRPARA